MFVAKQRQHYPISIICCHYPLSLWGHSISGFPGHDAQKTKKPRDCENLAGCLFPFVGRGGGGASSFAHLYLLLSVGIHAVWEKMYSRANDFHAQPANQARPKGFSCAPLLCLVQFLSLGGLGGLPDGINSTPLRDAALHSCNAATAKPAVPTPLPMPKQSSASSAGQWTRRCIA